MGTRAEQRDLWSRCWPKVHPDTLGILIDETPRYSTEEAPIDMSLKLMLAEKLIRGCTKEKADSLAEAARWHMKIVNYIDRCNYNNAKPADDHFCHYDEGEDELIIGTSTEDMDCLGLPTETAPTPTPSNTWYNPLSREENEGILWISPETTRLARWIAYVGTRYEIKSREDAVENFIEPGDELTGVDAHAGTAIKLMNLREIVSGGEIKNLLFRAALSHLKVVSSFHPRKHGEDNAVGGWRPIWPRSREK